MTDAVHSRRRGVKKILILLLLITLVLGIGLTFASDYARGARAKHTLHMPYLIEELYQQDYRGQRPDSLDTLLRAECASISLLQDDAGHVLYRRRTEPIPTDPAPLFLEEPGLYFLSTGHHVIDTAGQITWQK